jgi:hypothetical protein
MKARFSLALPVLFLLGWSASLALQRGGGLRGFPRQDNPAPMPPDWQEKAEFARVRLVYPNYSGPAFGRARGYGGGGGGSSWTTDYPKSDRIFLQGVRRLTRIQTHSIEQEESLDDDEIFQYPFVYAVEVGHWGLTDPQARKLREFLLRGGFLMVDDFHGSVEWEVFMESMSRVFPDRAVVDLANTEEIFHVLYDVDERVQVPGLPAFNRGVTYEQDGFVPRWRGILDDKGRIMVAICHNMDLGDAWEWADAAWYPERYTTLAYHIGINYIIYSMTH